MPKGRLEAFSDGVIAIVITLLVLEIHVPAFPAGASNTQVLQALYRLAPTVFAYLISFVICAVWWVSHHNFIHDLQFIDRPVLWINCLFLLWLAILPLPTALLGQNLNQPVVCMVYGINCALTGASFLLMRWYASGPGGLLKPEITPAQAKQRMKLSSLSPVVYTAAAFLAFLRPSIALAIFVAVPVYFGFVSLSGPRKGTLKQEPEA